MSDNNFDEWNSIKKELNKTKHKYFREKEIYFVSVGQNIGSEIYGKNDEFLRPVLVYKRLSKYNFFGIPLTSSEKIGSYYFLFSYKKDKISTALFNQIKVFDSRRIKYFSGKMKNNNFDNLKIKLLDFFTLQKRGGITTQGSQRNNEHIVLQKKNNVNSVFIIAEAGVNHNGSIELAKKLIDVAVDAGVDAVKFQTFKASNLVSKDAKKAQYQAKNIDDNDDSQYNMLKKLELDLDTHKELIAYCNSKDIMFLSTPFDHDSIELLNNLGLDIFKIPSGEITNLPYLRHIGSLDKKVILSTGMADMQEIKDALDILTNAGTKKENITILHANTMYPTPMEDVNLNAMLSIGKEFNVAYGYSDHTLGIEIPTAAVAMGASVIEKHFTLDCAMKGPDHKASLEPDELKAMVKAIRNIEQAIGDGIKKPSKSETPNIQVVRKSIVASCIIKKGELLSEENLAIKRPANGISPMKWDEVIGTYAKKDYNIDELI